MRESEEEEDEPSVRFLYERLQYGSSHKIKSGTSEQGRTLYFMILILKSVKAQLYNGQQHVGCETDLSYSADHFPYVPFSSKKLAEETFF